jgi:hypothetical protein
MMKWGLKGCRIMTQITNNLRLNKSTTNRKNNTSGNKEIVP